MDYMFIGFLITFIGFIVVAVFVLNVIIKQNKPAQNFKKEYESTYDIERLTVANDKVICVDNADYSLLKQAIIDFTKDYNKPKQSHLKPVSKIWKITDSKAIITFPYDIDFEIFCYYVNYIKYPIGIEYSPAIQAWTTTKAEDNWLNRDFENKRIMMFFDPNVEAYDYVMLTTEDDIPYKITFDIENGLNREKEVIHHFVANDIDLRNIDSIGNEMIN